MPHIWHVGMPPVKAPAIGEGKVEHTSSCAQRHKSRGVLGVRLPPSNHTAIRNQAFAWKEQKKKATPFTLPLQKLPERHLSYRPTDTFSLGKPEPTAFGIKHTQFTPKGPACLVLHALGLLAAPFPEEDDRGP